MRDKSKQNKGQILIELLVAMSLMLIGFLGIFSLLSQALGLNRVAANQYITANLAAEGIEVVKNILDSNAIQDKPWNDGLNVNGDFGVEYSSLELRGDFAKQNLNFDPNSGIYSYGSGKLTQFRRIITINKINDDEIQVNSKVEWKDRAGLSQNINLEDHFFNWR